MKRKLLLIAIAFVFFEILFLILCVNNSLTFRNLFSTLILGKKRVILVVGVISAPNLAHRREGIRLTWMAFCKRPDVVCKFFLDSLNDMDQGMDKVIKDENAKYGDIEYMAVPRGVNFARRILWILEWAAKNYVFDFVLRVDDDMFVCLQRLILELPYRSEKRLYWGYVHCEKEGQVRVDEEFLLLSADLVHEFLDKKDSLLCNPFGDISVSMWVNNVDDVTYFNDKRIYHEAGLAKSSLVDDVSLCHNYLALNSAYKKDTLLYWTKVQSESRTNFEIPKILPFEKTCNLAKHVDWKSFAIGHRFEPVRCMRKPTWKSLGKMYIGKQGAKAIDKNVLDPLGDKPVIPP
ncbi:beta-1,3-galactosyltransferase 6-like [Actinia tenebrosa]|uniref:Hexosyltransferase n=1 Tax=Actinia tenebrosa TaxID=6105 RepID=A0A6P8IPD3_ACTTE|nr:beta-1,3-galactosyltransferase 6-like [Actinia tenebrosa]